MSQSSSPYLLPVNAELQEPELQFDPLDNTQSDIHPLKGLAKFGPYTSSNPLISSMPIKVLAIIPEGYKEKIDEFYKLINSSHKPQSAQEYFIEYTGFKNIFRRDITVNEVISLPSDADEQIKASNDPNKTLYDLYSGALHSLRGKQFGLVITLIPNKWKPYITNVETEFDLHDKIKAFAASENIYCQFIEEWGDIFNSSDKCAVSWALSIALYTKAGGIPWTLKAFDNDRAYIGIGYALRRNPKDGKKFVVCCSQIFDSQGKGLNFVVFEASESEVAIDRNDNPFLTKATMRKVMSRSLEVYSKKLQYRDPPKKISVHKANSFTHDEIEGCKEAFYGMEDIELLHIQKKNDWKGMRILQGKTDNNACRRGSYIPLENKTALLWTQGAVQIPGNQWPYYKEKRAIPNPLLVNKSLGNSGWSDGCQNILRLTKMNWNTEKLYNSMPVTIKCAQKLAEVIKHSEGLVKTEYDYRLFM